jgi:hypothetical protein
MTHSASHLPNFDSIFANRRWFRFAVFGILAPSGADEKRDSDLVRD